ncbi:TPA: hypothetical protein DIV48_01190 [Candidatus Kaiserbacteria bacterium]|nr:MAG: hypothetical protein UY93_C0002G0031 [Parcubacteria group bacterium GW2011_GWA1_56_13]KKW46319.1 MAG: hypothetical protein UY97_C0007G0030 [Parcubacteria group bacterium GW2011_GWB1_57_6]HCR52246.1 hypothetical protein [Candidatus Kaiserbacteria bacterium]
MTLRIPKSPPSVDVASSVSVEEMEALLSEWFDGQVVLTSSGRSALLITLQELGFDRYTHRVAVPQMISKCVLDAVTCCAFPVDAAGRSAADATIQYPQYGFIQLTRPSGVVVEDIAHAFFSVPQKDAPRTIATFSLPKFFSTTTMVGGVIVADPSLARRLRERRKSAPVKSAETLAKEASIFRTFSGGGSGELSLLYTARLLNPRIESVELGGLPTKRSEIEEIRRKRRDIMETLLVAARHLVPRGWGDMLRDHLPYAFPVFASGDVLERLNRELREAGIESDLYRIDADRDMMHPRYEPMLLIPYSHLVSEEVLKDTGSILRSRSV